MLNDSPKETRRKALNLIGASLACTVALAVLYDSYALITAWLIGCAIVSWMVGLFLLLESLDEDV